MISLLHPRSWRAPALVLAGLACIAAPAMAQQTESRIVGRIVDPSDATLPGVTVNVTSKATGAIRTTVTEADGTYAVTNLAPGAYTLAVELAGFQTKTRDVLLGIGQVERATIALQIAGSGSSTGLVSSKIGFRRSRTPSSAGASARPTSRRSGRPGALLVRCYTHVMRDVLAVILGGGQGSRLFPLTHLRSKPAVPIGGKYRLIDIPISNCLHAGLRRIFVLTQFNSASLNRHVGQSYRLDVFNRGFVEILAAEQTP